MSNAKNEVSIASSVESSQHAYEYGKAHMASASAVAFQAEAFATAGIKADWIPVDSFVEGNVVHVAVFAEVARGYADGDERLGEMLKMTKTERAKLKGDEKDILEKARRTVRRLVMSYLTQVVYVLRGNAPQGVDSTGGGKKDRTTWEMEQRVMGGLMAIHNALSGTDKVPATQFWLDLRKLLDPAIDKLASQHGKAKAIKEGFDTKYLGSFSVKKKKK